MEHADVQSNLPKEIDEKTAASFKALSNDIIELFKDKWQQGDDIGDIILEAITSKKPHLRYSTNQHFEGLLKQKYSDLTGDSMVNASAEMFKLKNE